MDDELQRVNQEIAKLEEDELQLKKKERKGILSLDEEAELESTQSKLADRRDYRKTLVTSLSNSFALTQDIKTVESRETITLELYAPKATKTFTLVKIGLKRGRINIKALLREKRIKNLYFLETKELLLYDENGWSLDDDFVNRSVYKVRMEPDDGFDVAIGFSDAKIEMVEKHFNLSITQRWLPEESYDLIDIPESLFNQLVLLHKRNSLWSENARRTVISLFIINALDHVDVDNKLFVHEEMGFSCVREENGIRYKYSGPVDFAVGHSPVDSKLKKDCAFLFVEAKTVAKLGEALGQALAQAATNFIIRKQESKGIDGHLKVYWCISDGESWKFGYITEGKGNMLDVKQSITTTCWFHQSHMVPEKEDCSKLFSLIVRWVAMAMESSATTSRRNSAKADVFDLESLNASFIKASIN